MIKAIKRVLFACLSILGMSTLVWIVLLTNPSLSYANITQVDQVLIHHNDALEIGTEQVIKDAIEIIKTSKIYDENLVIQLCLNDDKLYPNLHPIPGGVAYAFLNKTVIYASKPKFEQNHAEFQWEANNYELRRYNLTELLAHEFMHNLQHKFNPKFFILNSFGNINWKFEGHADYIARGFPNDNRLKEKIEFYLKEETKDHVGFPVFKREDGTIQILSYFKYALVVQYLIEEKGLSYADICALEPNIDKPYSEMLNWAERISD